MSEPSTEGLREVVVTDDLRDVGVPMLLFTAASLTEPDTALTVDARVDRAAEQADVALAGLALFDTSAYRLQRSLGQLVLDES